MTAGLLTTNTTMNNKTPILEELKITIEGAVALFDAEADEDHPDPIDDAIELVREAEELLPEVIKSSITIPQAGPNDPDGLNEQRADWARDAIERFVDRTGTDKEDALCDLLCDLLHYADQYGYDFANELRRACDHFVAETTEP